MVRYAAALITLMALFFASQVHAQTRPIPQEEWTPEARLNLARCLVGEAGWDAPDHDAIPWALQRSWQARVRGGHDRTFAEQVRLYCQALSVERPTDRQLWVRALPDGHMAPENEPESFPDHLVWEHYDESWQNVLEHVDHWAEGHVRDACPRASDWGGTVDSFPGGAVRVCQRMPGSWRNTFYFVDPARVEAARLAHEEHEREMERRRREAQRILDSGGFDLIADDQRRRVAAH